MAQCGGYSNESPTFYLKETLAFCIKHVNENRHGQAGKKFVYLDEDDKFMLLLFSGFISDSEHVIKTCLEISVFLQTEAPKKTAVKITTVNQDYFYYYYHLVDWRYMRFRLT